MNNNFGSSVRSKQFLHPSLMQLDTKVFITLGEIKNIPATFKGISFHGYFVELDNSPGILIPMQVVKLRY